MIHIIKCQRKRKYSETNADISRGNRQDDSCVGCEGNVIVHVYIQNGQQYVYRRV